MVPLKQQNLTEFCQFLEIFQLFKLDAKEWDPETATWTKFPHLNELSTSFRPGNYRKTNNFLLTPSIWKEKGWGKLFMASEIDNIPLCSQYNLILDNTDLDSN